MNLSLIQIHFRQLVLCLLFSTCLVVTARAQEKTSDRFDDLYRQTEQVYSTDDLLVNGQLYVPDRPRARGWPSFGENRFTEGSIKIKGRQFDGELLKYNLETQRLILRSALNSGKYVTVVLSTDLVDEFNLLGQRFVNAGSYGSGFSGFYLPVYEGNFTFLIKYKKAFRAVYDDRTPYGSYNEMKLDYFLYRKGMMVKLNSKKALLNYFSPVKNEVKNFMRKNKISYKKASVAELNQLMKYCDSISRNKQAKF